VLPTPSLSHPDPRFEIDKGWMESSYDGLMAAQKKYGDKIKVQMIENINYADMDQALTNLAGKNELVIGVGGQTQASVYKIAKRFPKVHFSIVGGNEGESAPNVAGYDVKQAEIAYVAGAAAAMLSKNGAVSYVGGLEIPSIVNAGKEFGNGAKSINASIKYFENFTGDFDDVAKSKEATLARSRRAPTSTTTSSTSACAAWNRRRRKRAPISSAATPTVAAPIRSMSPTPSPAPAIRCSMRSTKP